MHHSVQDRLTNIRKNFLIASRSPQPLKATNSKEKMVCSLKNFQAWERREHEWSKQFGAKGVNTSFHRPTSINSLVDSNQNLIVSRRLTTFKDLRLETTFAVVLKLIKQLSVILTKSQDYKFDPEQFWISPSANVIILSELPKNSKNQYFRPSIHQQTKIGKKILELASSISCNKFQDFFIYYKRSLLKHPDCNFKHLQGLIRSYCVCTKIQLPENITIESFSPSIKTYNRILSSYQPKQRKLKTQAVISSRDSPKNKVITEGLKIPKPGFPKSGVGSPMFIKQRRKISITIEGEEEKRIRQNLAYQRNSMKAAYGRTIHSNSCKAFEDRYLTIPGRQEDRVMSNTRQSSTNCKKSVASTNRTSAHLGSLMKNSSEVGNLTFQSEQKDDQIEARKNKSHPFSFIPSHLEEVESQEGQNSDIEQRNSELQCSQKYAPDPIVLEMPKIIQQNWALNLESLMKPQKNHLEQSIVVGKEAPRRDSKVQKLDKMVNWMCESMSSKDLSEIRESFATESDGQY